MSVPRADDASDGEFEHKKSVSCEEEPSLVDTVLPLDLADAGVVARDNAGFLAEPAGPRIPGAPRALPVGLASLSQQVSPGRLESSRVGLAFPTARRRGAGGFDAGLSGVFERACLVRRASSVASSGVKGGDGQGGRRGDRLDPIQLGTIIWSERVLTTGCPPMGVDGRRTYRRRVGRYFTDRPGPRPARRRRTLPRHHSLDPCSSTEWEDSDFPRGLAFTWQATNRSIRTLQRTHHRRRFGRKIRAKPRRAIYF